jgi:hypothetical protein
LTLIFFGFIRDDPSHRRHPRSINVAETMIKALRAVSGREKLRGKFAVRDLI